MGTQSLEAYQNYGAIKNAPLGYFISVNPQKIIDDKGNVGVVYGNPKVIYIKLNALDSDTISFYYSGASLRQATYNKKVINPPTGMSTFASSFYLVIPK